MIKATFAGTAATKATFTDVAGPYLLLEDGTGHILLESSGKLLLEPTTVDIVNATFNSTVTTKANFNGA